MQQSSITYPKQSIFLQTMGCPKNEVDSLAMREALEARGYQFVQDANAADYVLINTCAFLQEAIEENIDVILEHAQSDRFVAEKQKIVVAGCLPSRFGEDLALELPEVSAFVPCNEEERIVSYFEKIANHAGVDSCECTCLGTTAPAAELLPSLDNGPVSAYIKIADGCNRFCSFCAIPYIRGRFHSFSYDSIKADALKAVQRGAKELVLIAQDTGIWGSDFKDQKNLAWLVTQLAQDFPDIWIRVLYLEPEGVTDEYLEAMAKLPSVCKYFDIPMQHCNPDILHLMNRKGCASEFLELIQKIRSKIPEAVIRTTLIAGFPGETQSQFEELLAFVEEAEFDYVGVFPYSQEDGTRAASLDNQLPDDVKVERAQQVRDLADSISVAKVANRVESRCDVIIEGTEEDGQLFGRSYFQAPEVDGYIYVDSGKIGEKVSVHLIDSLFYELEGEVE